MNALALALLSLALLQAQAPQADERIDRLIERADAIVVARVDALHPLPGTAVRLVELSLERVLFGDAARTHAFALPASLEGGKKANGLAVGQRTVLFLSRPRFSSLTKKQEKVVEALRKEDPLLTWASEGVWTLADSRVVVPGGLLPAVDGPRDVERTAKDDHAPEEALLGWLGARIAHGLPSIRVSYVGTGPSGWSFVLAPDGTIRGRGASVERVPPSQVKLLLELLETERFAELPEDVGASRGPDEPCTEIEVRRVSGRTRVLIRGDALESLSPPERDAAERALRVLRALPIAPPDARAPQK